VRGDGASFTESRRQYRLSLASDAKGIAFEVPSFKRERLSEHADGFWSHSVQRAEIGLGPLCDLRHRSDARVRKRSQRWPRKT
jgi:hypothetical protein